MAELHETVANRKGILSATASEYKSKPEIVRETSNSRSTVDRAIDELLDAGLIKENQTSYKATNTACHLCEQHHEYVEGIDAVANARPVLDDLAPDEHLPMEVLKGAEVMPPTPEMPERVARPFADLIRESEHTTVRGTRPVTLEMYNHLFHQYILDGKLTSETIFAPEIMEILQSEFTERMQKVIGTGELTGYVHDDLPSYTLAVFMTEEKDYAGILTHAENGIGASLMNDSPEAVQWVHNRVDELIEESKMMYSPSDQSFGGESVHTSSTHND